MKATCTAPSGAGWDTWLPGSRREMPGWAGPRALLVSQVGLPRGRVGFLSPARPKASRYHG